MIPNVTIRWCKKSAICRWCNKPIEIATPMVTVFFWNKGNEERRGWNTTWYFHPQHWIDQGLDYLSLNPYVPHKRGPKPKLSEEDRRTRFLLVRRFHALQQRKQKLKADYPDRLLIEARISRQAAEIIVEMIRVGGVPKSWAKNFQ